MGSAAAAAVEINGIMGQCGNRRVFLGFASASLLHELSFSDVLNEETGRGYQRKFSREHSLEFRRYIQRSGSTTIPLTFNLRPDQANLWSLAEQVGGRSTLRVSRGATKALAQVDCQHRLGFLSDIDIQLAFMTFVGLSVVEEMEVFNIINGKAKGLTSSLLDYHEARLRTDVASARPELYIALRLNELESSPWHKRLDLGGDRTVGLQRYASLRTMQKAVKRFLRGAMLPASFDSDSTVDLVVQFWKALSNVLEAQWHNPRRYVITKGIGVYSLMSLAGDLTREGLSAGIRCDEVYFMGVLSDFVHDVDWSNEGPMRGFGGVTGADQALDLIRNARRRRMLKVHASG